MKSINLITPFAHGVKSIATKSEVDTLVKEVLSSLDKSVSKVDREQYGENIYYMVYKHDNYIGTYLISPEGIGDSLQYSDDLELAEEWVKIVFQIHWRDLQIQFEKKQGPDKLAKSD